MFLLWYVYYCVYYFLYLFIIINIEFFFRNYIEFIILNIIDIFCFLVKLEKFKIILMKNKIKELCVWIIKV